MTTRRSTPATPSFRTLLWVAGLLLLPLAGCGASGGGGGGNNPLGSILGSVLGGAAGGGGNNNALGSILGGLLRGGK